MKWKGILLDSASNQTDRKVKKVMSPKRIFSIFLVFALCLLVQHHAGALELNAEGKKAYKTLKEVSYFAMGGVGIAGRTSSGEHALRVLLKQKESVAAFQALLKQGSRESRMYALVGLKIQDQKAFDQSITPYLDSKANVKSMRGCIMSDRPVAEVAKEIEKGVYH